MNALSNDLSVRNDGRSRSLRRVAATTFVGLVFGVAVGWGTGRFMRGGGLLHPPWSDAAALAIALFYLAVGLTMAILSVDRRGLALLANLRAPEFDRPVGPAQRLYLGLQAAVMILAGILLAAPVVLDVLAGGRAAAGGMIWMAAITSLFVLQSLLNLLLWNRSDEVFRQSIAETGAACFWLLQGALFLWASGEKLKVLPPITSWDAVTVMMGVYVLVSTVVAYRRGLA